MGLDVADESLGFLLGLSYRKLLGVLNVRLKEYDITPEQWSVLYRLSKQDGINQKEIARRSAKDQPTITRILDALEKKGFVKKQLCPNDRRAFRIYLTDKGNCLLDKISPIERETIEEMQSGLTSEQRELFHKLLVQIIENLTNREK
ncbi:MarR family winged helix-turn-helix transcriptional regulator [Brevibacillus ginsengisoli]|uniref:MarR family winged helix-turn-helix transcriptional regulator n=1 Tax=Brevibacillus ginsengisoli TaxID=363854 RepID=UPI003CF5CF7C